VTSCCTVYRHLPAPDQPALTAPNEVMLIKSFRLCAVTERSQVPTAHYYLASLPLWGPWGFTGCLAPVAEKIGKFIDIVKKSFSFIKFQRISRENNAFTSRIPSLNSKSFHIASTPPASRQKVGTISIIIKILLLCSGVNGTFSKIITPALKRFPARRPAPSSLTNGTPRGCNRWISNPSASVLEES